MSVDKKKFLARDFPLTINTGTDLAPVWTRITGLAQLGVAYSVTEAGTDDFDTDGWMSHLVAMRGLTLTVSGTADHDPVTSVLLPGQAALEALGLVVGASAFGTFRITRPNGSALEVKASVKCDPFGGGVNEASKFSAELKVNGKPNVIPAA